MWPPGLELVVCLWFTIRLEKHVEASSDQQRNQFCKCVPPYFCEGNKLIASTNGLLDRQHAMWYSFPDWPCSCQTKLPECDNYVEVCCFDSNAKNETEKNHPVCGYRNVDALHGPQIYSRINIKNTNTKFGEFPWMATITTHLNGNDRKFSYVCGGSLIHPQIVMTSAQCVHRLNKTNIMVRMGDWDLLNTNEILKHQNRQLQSVFIHGDFDPKSLNNNIALLITKEPYLIDDHIDIVCLPLQDEIVTNGAHCISTGWGKPGPNGKYQNVMKTSVLSMIGTKTCELLLGKSNLLNESFVCTNLASNGPCNGDGGSPLVCKRPGKEIQYQQVGIVSSNEKCSFPAVYTNVAHYKNWIEDTLRQNEFWLDETT